MSILTERNAEKYIATGGKTCPFCGSDKVIYEGALFYLEHEAMGQHKRCLACDKAWRNTYRLTGIMYEEYKNGEWDVQDFDFLDAD